MGFRRHEVVYLRLAGLVTGKDVLKAGCGEGYGAHLLAGHANSLHALAYDEYATGHVRVAYPDVGPYDDWDAALADQVRAVTVDDFSFSSDDLDESLDLIVVAAKAS